MTSVLNTAKKGYLDGEGLLEFCGNSFTTGCAQSLYTLWKDFES